VECKGNNAICNHLEGGGVSFKLYEAAAIVVAVTALGQIDFEGF
jgi:hypothetical protein